MSTWNVDYNVPSSPQYWQVFFRWAPPDELTQVARLAALDRSQSQLTAAGSGASRFLVDLEFRATLANLKPATINTCGIVGAQLLNVSSGIWSTPQISPASNGNTVPSFYNNVNAVNPGNPFAALDDVVLDSTPLPVGGVNYPIWTQCGSGPLRARVYAFDTYNPGVTWAVVYVQMNGNALTQAGATLSGQYRWMPVARNG